MHILLVTATEGELAPTIGILGTATDSSPRVSRYLHRDHTVDVLVTGVGMVPTAVWCARTLMASSYDVAFNLGVCGTFDRSLVPGTVVHIRADRMPELGAEDGDDFLTIHDLQLLGENEFPFHGGELVNLAPPDHATLRSLTTVTAITVNTVHGSDRSIVRVLERWVPRVESMEGAAFMYACLVHGVPFAQVRAVSNVVERRNREAWNLPEAIRSLNATALELLNTV